MNTAENIRESKYGRPQGLEVSWLSSKGRDLLRRDERNPALNSRWLSISQVIWGSQTDESTFFSNLGSQAGTQRTIAGDFSGSLRKISGAADSLSMRFLATLVGYCHTWIKWRALTSSIQAYIHTCTDPYSLKRHIFECAFDFSTDTHSDTFGQWQGDPDVDLGKGRCALGVPDSNTWSFKAPEGGLVSK